MIDTYVYNKPVSDALLVFTEYISTDHCDMTSNESELELVYGSKDAKHLIFGNSSVQNWRGRGEDGTVFGDRLVYGVFSRLGANHRQLLADVADTLAGLPEEDKSRRTCIVQVIIKTLEL